MKTFLQPKKGFKKGGLTNSKTIDKKEKKFRDDYSKEVDKIIWQGDHITDKDVYGQTHEEK